MRLSNPQIDMLYKAFQNNNVQSIDILYQDGRLKNVSAAAFLAFMARR